MKKNLLLCAFIGLFIQSFSAQLELTDKHTGIVLNNTTEVRNVFNTDFVTLDINVKNVGSSTGTFLVTRKIIDLPSAIWADQVCWGGPNGGTCIDTSSSSVIFSLVYPVTLDVDSSGLLNVKVKPAPLSGAPALYRYYVGTQGNPLMDSVDLQINSVLAVNENKKDLSLSISPNPANEMVKIQVNNFESGNMKIVDVLGNVVANTSFTGSKTINLANYKNGVYFIMISGNNIKTINRKLVIRH